MFFLKPILFVLGGATGIASFSSLSSLEWDPEYVWRIGSNSKFYLSNCFNDPNEKAGKWVKSNLQIYLTVKDSRSSIGDGTQLELWAQGYGGEIIDKEKIISPARYDNKSLQKTLKGEDGLRGGSTGHDSTEHEFQKWTTGIVLGETGAGESSQFFGDTIKCSNKFFDLENLQTSQNYRWDRVTFTLKKDTSKSNKYKDHEVYSIEIKTSEINKMTNSDTGEIKWADNFKPIVIK